MQLQYEDSLSCWLVKKHREGEARRDEAASSIESKDRKP
jgi:hypothetical protein